jgi:WD40 repeat protein
VGLTTEGDAVWTGCRECRDGRVAILKLWDISSGAVIRTFERSNTYINIAFSPNGKVAAISEFWPPSLKLWDLDTKKETMIVSGKDMARSFVFSPDSKHLALITSERILELWDVAARKRKLTFQEGFGLRSSPAFTPDGRFVAAIGSDSDDSFDIKLWDVTTGKQLIPFKCQSENPTCLTFSPDGKTLAVGDSDGILKLWDVSDFTIHNSPHLGTEAPIPSGVDRSRESSEKGHIEQKCWRRLRR